MSFFSMLEHFLQDPAVRHEFEVIAPKAAHLLNSNKGWARGGPPSASDAPVYVNNDKDIPPSVDLRGPNMPPVYDQGKLGSCTANAIAGAFQYTQKKNGISDFTPSRLFIYYNERNIEGDVDKDNGAVIKDGMTTIQQQGVCHESTWPYEVGRYDAKPPQGAYDEAMNNQALKFAYVQGDDQVDAMKRVLHAGWPVIFGFDCPQSFEGDDIRSSGMLAMPDGDGDNIGGHAILAVGYDDSKQCFIIRNSWGPGWGDGGYFYMPYAYVGSLNRASDFWVLNSVEDGRPPGHDDGTGPGPGTTVG